MKTFNKKSESRLLTPFLFLILGLIAITIVIAVLMFYSKTVDIRSEEAKIMSNKLIYAVSDSGYLDKDFVIDKTTIFKKADIKKSFMDSSPFYFNVTVYKEGNTIISVSSGDYNFEKQCFLPGEVMAKCLYKTFYLLNSSNSSEKFQVKVLTGSNQIGSKI